MIVVSSRKSESSRPTASDEPVPPWLYLAHWTLALGTRASWLARPVGTAFVPLFDVPTAQVACRSAMAIVAPPAPVSGPAGDATLMIPVPALLVRMKPVMLPPAGIDAFSFAARWAFVLSLLVKV